MKQDNTPPELAPGTSAAAERIASVDTNPEPDAEAVLTVTADTEIDAAVDAVMAANITEVATEPPPPASIVHRVERGDTLFSLAKSYGTTVASLKRWNQLRSNMILVGQRLTIFTGQVATATH